MHPTYPKVTVRKSLSRDIGSSRSKVQETSVVDFRPLRRHHGTLRTERGTDTTALIHRLMFTANFRKWWRWQCHRPRTSSEGRIAHRYSQDD